MASNASSFVSPSAGNAADGGVSLARLHVLRATYALLVAGLGLMNLPELVGHAPDARGVIPALLGAIFLLALLGLRYPLQMLPLLLFELAWKTIWLLDYGLPQWFSGQTPPTFAGDFQAIAAGVILMPLVIPWGHVYRHYIMQPAERWR
jgi:hypothetical protein